jgi:hypothetical protein
MDLYVINGAMTKLQDEGLFGKSAESENNKTDMEKSTDEPKRKL